MIFASVLGTIYVPIALSLASPASSPEPAELEPAIPTPSSPFPSSTVVEGGCEVTVLDDRGNDGFVDSVERLFYAPDGRLTLRETWRGGDTAAPRASVQRYTYDDASRLIRVTTTTDDLEDNSVREYRRDSAGRLVWDVHRAGPDDEILHIGRQHYDVHGMIVKRLDDFSGDGFIDKETRYSRAGDMWVIDVTTRAESIEISDTTWIDVDDRGIVRQRQDTDGNGSIDLFIEYKYDLRGRMVEQWGGESSPDNLWWTIAYGDFGVIREGRYFADGSVDRERTYTYDELGRRLSRVERHHAYPARMHSYSYICRH